MSLCLCELGDLVNRAWVLGTSTGPKMLRGMSSWVKKRPCLTERMRSILIFFRMGEMNRKKLSLYSQGKWMVSLYDLTVSAAQSQWQRGHLFLCLKIKKKKKTFIPAPKRRTVTTNDAYQRHCHCSSLLHPGPNCYLLLSVCYHFQAISSWISREAPLGSSLPVLLL